MTLLRETKIRLAILNFKINIATIVGLIGFGSMLYNAFIGQWFELVISILVFAVACLYLEDKNPERDLEADLLETLENAKTPIV